MLSFKHFFINIIIVYMTVVSIIPFIWLFYHNFARAALVPPK